MVFAPFGISLLVAFFSILILIPRLKRIKIVGKDMHKPGQPDDLIGLRQWVKTLLPLIAALPLLALRAGRTTMKLPWWGWGRSPWVAWPSLLPPWGSQQR